MDPIDELTKQLAATAAKAASLTEQLASNPSAEDVKAIRDEYTATKAQVDSLMAAKAQAEKDAEIKAMQAQIADLTSVISQRSERKHEFGMPAVHIRNGALPEEPFTVKLWKAKNGDIEAINSLKALKALGEAGGAAGAGASAGGYLVPPSYIQELVALRRASTPLRNFISVVGGIKTNLVYVPTQTGVSTVGWTAENAPKPSTDETFGQLAVNIYTLAGIAKVSNQLLEDSSPAVDQIVKTDLGRGLGIEEDRAMINGSGTGQPTGILNTSGITATPAAGQTPAGIYDDILAAIARLQQSYFGQPDAILMHPRTWAKLLTAKDSAGRFLGIGTLVGSQTMMLPGVPSPTGAAGGGTVTTLFGIPLVIDANMPINLTVAANANRSAIVVGAFKEFWLLERDGIQMDVSNQAGTSFEQNQTWFRGEERVGFTAARLTSAAQIITDEGP